jgi:hypothetical protein
MESIIPDAKPMVIALRAYAEPPPKQKGDGGKTGGKRRAAAPPSEWMVIFDTETTIDASQALRLGSYQVRKRDRLIEAGLFHVASTLTKRDMAVLTTFTKANGLSLISREEFVDRVFYGIGYELRATIVGFNLPFDLARLAIGHSPARGRMRGGFSLRLAADKRKPRLQVKHLSQRASLIQFAAPYRQRNARSERRRHDGKPVRRGFFVDVKTLAAALYSRTFDLAGLTDFLVVDHPKLETEEHGKALTAEYAGYAARDVQATWECYRALVARYRTFRLDRSPPHSIFSEASIGKAYLAAMNVRPWREVQPDAPAEIMALALGTYFGGRSEVRIRRELRQITLCDFLAMYPTVCTLMRLWSFVIAEGTAWRDGTEEVRSFFEAVTLADLQKPETWPKLRALVQIAPDADILPTRAPYDGAGQATIGLNFLSSERPLWFTLADAVASKLLTGRSPKVVRAVVFKPGAPQAGLASVDIAGNAAYRVDPSREDFFKRLTELRQATKRRRDATTGAQYDALDAEQNALKIAANATSYGIFAETNVSERAKRGTVKVHSSVAQPYEVETLNDEEPGRYFHPLLAALITGAARLMLAITERLIADVRLEWSFCDTDSMAIAKPNAMADDDYQIRVGEIVGWFEPLNPYAFDGSILKVEDVNSTTENKTERRPLYCWAVSAKRYVLFNLDAERRPVIRQASAHGLGHLRRPYDKDNLSATIPPPAVKLTDLGVDRWQHDVWWQIAKAAIDGHPDQVDFDFHPALDAPAVSRYAATTPRLLGWVANYNRNLPYERQIRPFGFLLCMFADPLYRATALGEPVTDGAPPPKRRRSRLARPIAPFDKDPAKAARHAFDRETGEPVPSDALKSYRTVLASYAFHPEAKFLNGDFLDRGPTCRRHVRAVGVRLIGKEANRWEEQFFTGIDDEAQPEYGSPPDDAEVKLAELRRAVEVHGLAAIAVRAGVQRTRAVRALKSATAPTPGLIEALALAAAALDADAAECSRSNAELRQLAVQRVEVEGLPPGFRRDERGVGAPRGPSSDFQRIPRRAHHVRIGSASSAVVRATGRPVGSADFIEGLERSLCRPIARRAAGRKPKAAAADEPDLLSFTGPGE